MIVAGRFLAVAAAILVGAAPVSAAPPFLAFESGPVRPMALSADGSRLYAVNTPYGQLEVFGVDGTSGSASAISAGDAHSCAIQSGTGAVVCWGGDAYGQALPPDSVNGVSGIASAISAGRHRTFALPEPGLGLSLASAVVLLAALGSRGKSRRSGGDGPASERPLRPRDRFRGAPSTFLVRSPKLLLAGLSLVSAAPPPPPRTTPPARPSRGSQPATW